MQRVPPRIGHLVGALVGSLLVAACTATHPPPKPTRSAAQATSPDSSALATPEPSTASRGFPSSPTHMLLVFGAGVGNDFFVYDVDRRQGHPVQLAPTFPYDMNQTSPMYGAFIDAGSEDAFDVGPKDGRGAGRAYVTTHDLSGPLRLIVGAASGMVPARRSNAAWIGTPAGLREYDLSSGSPVSAPVKLPSGISPVGEVSTGLLTITQTDYPRIEVRDRSTGAVARVIARRGTGHDPLAFSADEVAWRDDDLCTACAVHLTNVRTGADRIVSMPSGVRGPCVSGAFSPDAREFAVIFDCPRAGKGTLVLVDVKSGRATVVPDSQDSVAYFGAYWSPDSQWVFWTADIPKGPTGAEISTYRVGAAHSTWFDVQTSGGGGLFSATSDTG